MTYSLGLLGADFEQNDQGRGCYNSSMQELQQSYGEPPVLRNITRPTLVLDEERARRNIARMAEKARRSWRDASTQ